MSKIIGDSSKRSGILRLAIGLALGLAVLIVMTLVLRVKNFAVFNPKGIIANQQLSLIVFSAVFLFAIAAATLLLLYFFAWKYRETNNSATYDPHIQHGKFFAFSMWAFPTLIMLIMVFVMLPATHSLEPRKQITSANKPLTIQVIAMRWKWVFIYPEQHIATVNDIQIPINTPVVFELTADEAPMSSFWIPNLAGQLYAMTGHVNSLNLMANKTGDYPGSSAEINGAGFADMKFVAHARSQEDFDLWLKTVKNSPNVLDSNEYSKLVKPSVNNRVAVYALAQSDLVDTLLVKYNGSHGIMGSMSGMGNMGEMDHK